MEFTLIFLFVFAGVYLGYAASRRVQMTASLGIEPWSQVNRQASRLLGLLMMAGAGYMAVRHWGPGSGLLALVVIWMTMASLVVVLAPLGQINRSNTMILLVLMAALEMVL